ncbi:cell division protein MraZ [Cutibacterium acnes JCM 18909]|nr:cell division protein MraZ [Cutibacterium acnes JCM 18909]
MFLGTHTPKLDEKGRFFLPAKFRDELDDGWSSPEARTGVWRSTRPKLSWR